MNKGITILLAILFMAYLLPAQKNELGVDLGFNIYFHVPKEGQNNFSNTKYTLVPQFQYGINYQLNLSPIVSLSTGFMASRKAYKTTEGNHHSVIYELTNKRTDLYSLPLSFKFHVLKKRLKPFIQVGAITSWVYKSKRVHTDIDNNYPVHTYNKKPEHLFVSEPFLAIGVDYKIKDRFIAGFTFSNSLIYIYNDIDSDFNNVFGGDGEGEGQMRTFHFNFSFRYIYNKKETPKP
jgi:hypothetical protein